MSEQKNEGLSQRKTESELTFWSSCEAGESVNRV